MRIIGIISFVVLLFNSCVEINSVKEIRMLIYPKGLTLSVPFTCHNFGMGVNEFLPNEKIVNNDSLLQQLNQFVIKIKNGDIKKSDISPNNLIQCHIIYLDEKTDTICLGTTDVFVFSGNNYESIELTKMFQSIAWD